jgi:hypothetical protein
VTRGVDDLLADLDEAADAAAELVRLGKESWDTERPLRLAGEAVIGRLGAITSCGDTSQDVPRPDGSPGPASPAAAGTAWR